MKINPLIQPIKIQKSEMRQTFKSVNIGDFLKGQVVQSEGNNLTLSMDGQLITVLNTLEQDLPVGETVTLQVTGFAGETPLTEVAMESGEGLEQEKALANLLVDLKLPINGENQRLVRSMVEFNVPLTQENVMEIKTAFTSLKLLAQSGELQQGQIKTEVPIKEAVIAFLKEPDSEGQKPPGQKAVDTEQIPKLNTQFEGQVKRGTTALAVEVNVEMPLENASTETKVPVEKTVQTEVPDPGVDAKEQVDLEKTTDVQRQVLLTTVKDMVDRGDVEKLTMLLKSKMPLTLKNAVVNEQVVFGKKTITESIGRLGELLNQLKDTGVLDEPPKALFDKLDHPMELLKEVEEFVKEKDGPDEVGFLKEVLSNEVQFLKDAVEFVEDLNQEVGFVQIPMEMNGEIVNMDLYTSKGNGKKGSEEFSIFVSLDTKTMAKVQVSIKKYPQTVALNFLLENESIKKRFVNASEVLGAALENLELGDFTLVFNERKKAYTFSDFLKGLSGISGFDMMV